MPIPRTSDEAIAEQMGLALRERRLNKNIKQADLALAAGVSTSTLQKLESGKGNLLILIAVLRALNELALLGSLLAPPRLSPRAVAKTGKTHRVRAAGRRPDENVKGPISPLALPDPVQGQTPHLLIPRSKRG